MIIAKEHSRNQKLGDCSTTYAGLTTCHDSCPFKKSGVCYGLNGPVGYHFRRVTRQARAQKASSVRLAQKEAALVKQLSGAKPLRLHTVGDCKNVESAQIISQAAAIYSAKCGQPVWTYTHTPDVPREAWGEVSVLKSCHTLEEVKAAHRAGYAASLVVKKFTEGRRLYPLGGGFIGIACKAQIGETTCGQCKLCFKDQMLHDKRFVVLFETHGARKRLAAQDAIDVA